MSHTILEGTSGIQQLVIAYRAPRRHAGCATYAELRPSTWRARSSRCARPRMQSRDGRCRGVRIAARLTPELGW